VQAPVPSGPRSQELRPTRSHTMLLHPTLPSHARLGTPDIQAPRYPEVLRPRGPASRGRVCAEQRGGSRGGQSPPLAAPEAQIFFGKKKRLDLMHTWQHASPICIYTVSMRARGCESIDRQIWIDRDISYTNQVRRGRSRRLEEFFWEKKKIGLDAHLATRLPHMYIYCQHACKGVREYR
jgi:hypothetical protein